MSRRIRPPRPLALLAPATLAVVFLLIPLLAMVLMAPWTELPTLLASSEVVQALRLSLLTASMSAAICLVVGVPLGWVLSQSASRGARIVRSLVTVPLVLPPVVGGVALLLAYGRVGLVGHLLDEWLGVRIPFTTVAVVMAQTFVALPFMVVTIEGAVRAAGTDLDEAAATLGASRATVFATITVPLIGPSLVAGTVLAWARALGEFGATVTFAGNLPGVTQTMPSAVYRAFETNPPAAVALSLILLAVSVVVLVVFRERWRQGRSSW